MEYFWYFGEYASVFGRVETEQEATANSHLALCKDIKHKSLAKLWLFNKIPMVTYMYAYISNSKI